MIVHVDVKINLEANETVSSEDVQRIQDELKKLKHEAERVIKKLLQKDDPIKAFERARVL